LCCIPYCSCWGNYDIIIFNFLKGGGILVPTPHTHTHTCIKPWNHSVSAYSEMDGPRKCQSSPWSPQFAAHHSLGWGTLSWSCESEIWHPNSVWFVSQRSRNLNIQGSVQSVPSPSPYPSHSSILPEGLKNLHVVIEIIWDQYSLGWFKGSIRNWERLRQPEVYYW